MAGGSLQPDTPPVAPRSLQASFKQAGSAKTSAGSAAKQRAAEWALVPSHAWGSRQAAVSPVRAASGVAGIGAATGFSASLASTPARVVGASATPSSSSMPAARALGFPTPSSRGATGSLSASLPSAALDIHARYAMMQRQQQVS